VDRRWPPTIYYYTHSDDGNGCFLGILRAGNWTPRKLAVAWIQTLLKTVSQRGCCTCDNFSWYYVNFAREMHRWNTALKYSGMLFGHPSAYIIYTSQPSPYPKSIIAHITRQRLKSYQTRLNIINVNFEWKILSKKLQSKSWNTFSNTIQ